MRLVPFSRRYWCDICGSPFLSLFGDVVTLPVLDRARCAVRERILRPIASASAFPFANANSATASALPFRPTDRLPPRQEVDEPLSWEHRGVPHDVPADDGGPMPLPLILPAIAVADISPAERTRALFDPDVRDLVPCAETCSSPPVPSHHRPSSHAARRRLQVSAE
jgi:hypothetical protein